VINKTAVGMENLEIPNCSFVYISYTHNDIIDSPVGKYKKAPSRNNLKEAKFVNIKLLISIVGFQIFNTYNRIFFIV